MIILDKPNFCFTAVLSLTVVIWMASGCKKPETEEEIKTALPSKGQMEKGTSRDASGEAGMKEAEPPSAGKMKEVLFRGNLRRTGVVKTMGVHELRGLKWKFKTGGEVITSPLVADGKVFFGSFDRNLYATDINTGKLRWKFDVGGHMTTPAIAYGAVFFASGLIKVLDINTGKEKAWLPEEADTSLAFADGVAYFGGAASGAMHAASVEDESINWKFETDGKVLSSPAIADGAVFFGSVDRHFYAVEMDTGKLRWKLKTKRGIGSTPAVSERVVYFSSDKLYAVDTKTGKVKWKVEPMGGPTTSPAVGDEMVYFGSDGGPFFAVDKETGKTRWQFKTGSVVYSPPSIADGVVYFGCNDGWLYAADMITGKLKWKFKAGGSVGTSPAVADGVVYFGSNDGNLYAVH